MKLKKKICLLLSCLACVSMLAWKPLPTEAAACPHTICQIYGIPIPTGVVFSYNGSTHTIEYGTEHTCTNCGYRFFKDTYSHTESHHFSAELRYVGETTTQYIYAADCSHCPQVELYYRWK